MDTQRIILFCVFVFSSYLLWGEWQKAHAPVALPQQQAASGAGQGAVPPKDVPVSSATGAAPAAGAVPAQSDKAPKGQTITIRTDLYTAEVDTAGGVISMIALDQHRDSHDTSKPYLALQRNAERTYIAQAGLLGEGMPNHRTLYEALPGPRELAKGEDRVELKLQATTPSGDKVVQVLTFHRGSYVIDAAFDVTNAGSAPLSSVRSSTPSRTSTRRSNSARSTKRPPIRRASARTRKARTTAGSAWSSTIS
jgi:YidC/Oxa1 family membrane protein insertase